MRLSKKFAAIAITAGVALTATAAFAYWTTTGSGSGAATAASSNGTVTLAAGFGEGITPGSNKAVIFRAWNTGTTDLYVGTVSLSTFSGVDPLSPAGVVTNPDTCLASDFSMGSVVENTRIPAQTSPETAVVLPNNGLLVFANSTANQDHCKGAVITLNVVSN